MFIFVIEKHTSSFHQMKIFLRINSTKCQFNPSPGRKKKNEMPTECKKCRKFFDQSRILYELKVSRQTFVNLVENNITTWSFKTPLPHVARYLNLAISNEQDMPSSYIFPMISPKHGLVMFVEAERCMSRKRFCKKCSFDHAYAILSEMLEQVHYL